MKFINFDTVLKCNKNNVINKNKFTPQHCSNFLIVGKAGIGKTNFLLNILHFTLSNILRFAHGKPCWEIFMPFSGSGLSEYNRK